MARVLKLEKYVGELDGHYQTVWVAESENGNFWRTTAQHGLEYTDKGIPDIKATKWLRITNETMKKIDHYMLLKETIKYKPELKRTSGKDRGMSM